MDIKKEFVPMVKETFTEFQTDDAGQLGAALSYYAMSSLFPLLIVLLSVLGFLLRFWDNAIDAEQQIIGFVSSNVSADLGNTVGEMIAQVREQAGAAAGIGLITLLITASGVFGQLDKSFNKIWNVPEKKNDGGILNTIKVAVTQKLSSIFMVLGVVLLLFASVIITGLTQVILEGAGSVLGFGSDSAIGQTVAFIAGLLITLVINTLMFALLFKYLPDVKVEWRDVFVGAAVTAILWEIAKRLLALYISNGSSSAYGVFGSILALMAWIYFSSQVMFLGAEFTEVYSRHHGSRMANPVVPKRPKEDATIRSLPTGTKPATTTVITEPNREQMAQATGVGLAIGSVGGAVAALAALVIGARRAITGAPKRK